MKEDENKKQQTGQTKSEPVQEPQEKPQEVTDPPVEKTDDEDTGYVVVESGLGIDE